MSILKKLSLSCVLSVILMLFGGCDINFSQSNSKEFSQKSSNFYLYDENQNVYTLNQVNEISSKCNYIKFIDDWNVYVASLNNGSLYIMNKDGEKEKLYSNNGDTIYDKYYYNDENIKYNDNNIYFKTSNNDLYVKGKDSDKEKIDSNVTYFSTMISDGIIYLNENYDLYIKLNGQDKIKIASEVENYDVSEDSSKILYVARESIYLYDVKTCEKEKVKQDFTGYSTFINNKSILCSEGGYGEYGTDLYYIELDGEKKLLASDVQDCLKFSTYVLYMDMDGDLLKRNYKDDKSEKILDDVKSFQLTKSGEVFFTNYDLDLYKLNTDLSKQKIIQDAVRYDVSYDNVVAINGNDELFIGDVKIANDVVSFIINGKEICYITDSDEVFLVNEDLESELIIDDFNDYTQVRFNDYQIY